jgi:ATP adenylyltransferase
VSLERLWAGWRREYVGSVGAEVPGDDCVLCRVLADEGQVVWRGETTAAIVNAFPYTSGHLLVLPVRHVGEMEELSAEEGAALWAAVTDAVRALKAAYRPDGLNVGVNLGRSAGAGIPGHFHLHVLPRWNGDTNFMTTVAETRVVPEALDATVDKLRAAWPDAASRT